jgi:hypothetical protein
MNAALWRDCAALAPRAAINRGTVPNGGDTVPGAEARPSTSGGGRLHTARCGHRPRWPTCRRRIAPSLTMVGEQYLLDREREAFLKLCGERKTLERIQHTLKTGKPLRN